MQQGKFRINVALAAAIGLGRKQSTERTVKQREIRIRKRGGMDLDKKENHDREIRANLRLVNETIEASDEELGKLLLAYDTAENDPMGVEFKALVMTWGDQLADDLKGLRVAYDELDNQAAQFIERADMDPIEAIAGSISLCTSLQDLAANHVRNRTTTMDHFQCEVRDLKKRYGSK